MIMLAQAPIGAARPEEPCPPVTGLTALGPLDLFARLDVQGSAGAAVRVRVQTSLDGGLTWFDVAAFAFTGSAVLGARLPAVATMAPLALTPLPDGAVRDGPFGDRLRATIESSGTYGLGTVVTVLGRVGGRC